MQYLLLLVHYACVCVDTKLHHDGFGIRFWPTPDQGRRETPVAEKQ